MPIILTHYFNFSFFIHKLRISKIFGGKETDFYKINIVISE